jgi:tripartite-type tricarboxylate transporter receptor subunit TctC
MPKMLKLTAVLTTICCLFGADSAWADYPDKPIRLVVPYAPGGAFNLIARVLSQRLSESLGQPVVIDNRGGAGGIVGADIVAKSAPDGYTLLMSSSGIQSFQPMLYKSLPYDAAKDFTQVALFASVPNVVVVANKVPASNLKDLVEYSRKNQLFMGSAGNGSVTHMIGELFQHRTNTHFTHIPYKGGGPASVDLAGGQIDVLFVNIPSVLPFIQGGKVRALAVLSDRRSAQLPTVPTASEAGFKNVDVDSWVGILAPAGTPKAIVDKLSRAIVKAANDSGVIGNLAEQGVVTMSASSDGYAQLVQEETKRWADLLKTKKISID